MSGLPDGRPSARDEVRVTELRTLPGKNFWSRRPITRLDLSIGAFEDISSAEAPGCTARLVDALPGLVEHQCSVGRPGGFVERLERGTYIPHIVEHVSLEIQRMAGAEVAYGRARGGEHPGEYVVAFEHHHALVGWRSAVWSTALVCAAFDGESLRVAEALAALGEAAGQPDQPAPSQRIDYAVCGDAEGCQAFARALRDGAPTAPRIEALAPVTIVERGLPYATARVAVALDPVPGAAPPAFTEADRAEQLFSVLVDGLEPGGALVCPDDAMALQRYAAERGHAVATFPAGHAAAPAAAAALARDWWPRGGRAG
jgi:hypothetical protein